MNTDYKELLNIENQDAIIGGFIGLFGVIVGVVLTKFSELVQFTNRRERRASWPKYRLIPSYELNSNHFVGIGKGQETLEFTVYTQDLIESGGRELKINGYKNIQTDKIQLPERKERHLILDLKKFDPDKYLAFFIQVKYMRNGFYYTDYWRGRLVLKNNGYQIKFYSPVDYFGYVIQILKSYFKRRKPHPWED